MGIQDIQAYSGADYGTVLNAFEGIAIAGVAVTALVVLVTFGDQVGMENVLYKLNADGSLYYTDTAVSMMAFQDTFKVFGTVVYAIIIPLFAFTTILAWSYYGEKSIDFLFRKTGDKGRKIAKISFKVLYVLLVIVAALLGGEDNTWFGQLMARPQLLAWLLELDAFLSHYRVEIV